MFDFFKSFKKKEIQKIGEVLKVDMHSHILPGIDDGSPDLETSIELVKGFKALGYEKLIATPHTFRGLYNNTNETIKDAFVLLKGALESKGIGIELEMSSEYYVDHYFEELLKDKALLPFGDKNYILIEMSYVAPSNSLENVCFDLITQGYTPILAHPERYSYWHKKPESFDYIISAGCLLQVNLLSLAGYYGKDVKKSAEYFLENDKVSFLGSDVHHMKHLNKLYDVVLPKGNFLNSSL